MTSSTVNTKLEAYKLVHDPARLLSLIFSKYGDIQEDFNLLIANQLVFNKSSHLNILYKESKILQDKDEYLRRFYKNKESLKRIPKLNDYYKNYHIFFCKATITDFELGNVLKNYEDNKAEIFYKNNYNDTNINKEDNDKSDKGESSSLSSLDNITYNKIIFDKRNREIIDKDFDSKNLSITLTLDSLRLNNNKKENSRNLIIEENSEKDDSFIQSIKNIVFYQENKGKNKNNIKNNNNIIIKEIVKNKNISNSKDNKENRDNKENKDKKENSDNKDNKDNKDKKEKRDNKDKMNNLSSICKKINENIKSKKNNKNQKVILEKKANNSSKDNKEKNNSKLLNKLNIHN